VSKRTLFAVLVLSLSNILLDSALLARTAMTWSDRSMKEYKVVVVFELDHQ
jgi:hypothetical protein